MEILTIIAIGIIAIFVVIAIAKLDETVRRMSVIEREKIGKMLNKHNKEISQVLMNMTVDEYLNNGKEFAGVKSRLTRLSKKLHNENIQQNSELWNIKTRLTASKKREEKILRHERVGNASLEETLKVVKKIEKKILKRI